jgi:hypothetical protein
VLTDPKARPEPAKAAADAPKPAETSAAQSLDIQNLWSQLVGAGLVTGANGAIPGLEVPAAAVDEVKQEKKEVAKKEKVEEAKPKPPPPKKPEPVLVVKTVVLKSHDKSLKE